MAMQCDKAPYDNPDIRMALKLATDREQILKALFSGYGTVGNDHPIPPSDPYFNKELPQRKYDPEQAAVHLQEGGHRRSEDPAAGVRRRVQRRGRRGRAAPGERGQGRDQGRPEEGARGRVLGQRLAQGPVRFELLGRARGGDADALGRLCGGRALERDALEQREVREAARRRPRRDGRGQAPALHLGNAGDAATSRAARSFRCSRTGSTPTSTRSAGIRRTAASTWTTAISCRRPGSRPSPPPAAPAPQRRARCRIRAPAPASGRKSGRAGEAAREAGLWARRQFEGEFPRVSG